MPKRAAAKLSMRLSFETMPSQAQLDSIRDAAIASGAVVKAADLTYVTQNKVNLK